MIFASACTRGDLNTSCVGTTLRCSSASGIRQFGYCVDVPGWFCARLAHAVHERGLQQQRRRVGEHGVHRLDNGLQIVRHIVGGLLTHPAALHEQVEHGLPFGERGFAELLHRLGEQAELLAQFDLLEHEIAGGRRQIVCGDRRK